MRNEFASKPKDGSMSSSTPPSLAPRNVIGLSEKRARKLIDEGFEHFSRGSVQKALTAFEDSLRAHTTADAYTYCAWMLSFAGELDVAIELCKKAISLDPEFGNPYNDIGTYFMKKGELQSAIPWLERAKHATRYSQKQFPFLNLGRIYLSQGMFLKALTEFEQALVHDPENGELHHVVAHLRQNHS